MAAQVREVSGVKDPWHPAETWLGVLLLVGCVALYVGAIVWRRASL
jgi:hypothetical protein